MLLPGYTSSRYPDTFTISHIDIFEMVWCNVTFSTNGSSPLEVRTFLSYSSIDFYRSKLFNTEKVIVQLHHACQKAVRLSEQCDEKVPTSKYNLHT